MKVNVAPTVGHKMAEEESKKWSVPKDLEGKVVDSFDALQQIIPQNEEYQIERSPDITCFEAYVRTSRANQKDKKFVAYGCSGCKKIVIGQPEIRPIDMVGDLKSRCGYDMACRNCGSVIYHKES